MASFRDVLDARSCSLDHLVMRAAPFSRKLITKSDGNIESQTCNLKAFEPAIATMFGNQFVGHLSTSKAYITDLSDSKQLKIVVDFNL